MINNTSGDTYLNMDSSSCRNNMIFLILYPLFMNLKLMLYLDIKQSVLSLFRSDNIFNLLINY